MTQERDRETGRFVHVWGWMGYTPDGREWQQCQHCQGWKITQTSSRPKRGPEVLYHDPGRINENNVSWRAS